MSLDTPTPDASSLKSTFRWVMAFHCLLLLAVAVFLRGWQLDHLPGVNGDEAWMGVQAQRFLDTLGSGSASGEGTAAAVEWTTPTGNAINWLLFWPTVLLHAWLPPSIGLLRLPAMLSGVLALGINYWLAKRVFGQRLATISTIVLAVLPINIAYARFGWDASQSLLVTLPVLYLSLLAVNEPQRRRLWLLWAAASQALALLVHPTNIFTAPLLVIAGGTCYWPEIRLQAQEVQRRRLVPFVLSAASLLVAATTWLLWPWVEIAITRVATPGELGTFLARWVDLFSGVTVYQFIPGSLVDGAATSTIVYRTTATLVVTLAMWGAYQRTMETRTTTLKVLLGGSLVSLIGFFLIAGPEAIRPHFERYGLCLIASGSVVLSLGADWWLTRPKDHWTPLTRLAVPALAWLLLTGYGVFYVGHFNRTGGDSHAAFRTAEIEPKQAALQTVLSGSNSTKGESADGSRLIVAADWWTYWPLAYLAHGRPEVTVCQADASTNDLTTATRPRRDNVYWVGFHDTPARKAWLSRCQAAGYAPQETRCNDYAGRAVLSILRVQKSSGG